MSHSSVQKLGQAKRVEEPFFLKGIPEDPKIVESWRLKWSELRKRKKILNSKMEEIQEANCSLAVREFAKPTEQQKYLFINDQERVGALRLSFLKNCCITKPNTGMIILAFFIQKFILDV